MIVFGSGSSGLGVISALGGVPSVLTTPAVDRGERAHWYPQVLPGGREVLFTVSATEGNRLALFSRDTGEWHTFNEHLDRLARFEREAKVLASLNHPNIGHIYGLEEC